ncbi:WD domain repeat-containing protein 55 [Coemansia sp. RSA 988]|nr:WD domain repeat-containing protein 55 [Coemansia sp. RSA 988]
MDNSVARPKSLKFKEPVIDVAFSPTADLVASSLITGHVFVHRYSVDGNTRQQRRKVHKKSCRSVCFSGDGELLYTGSKDRSWQAMDVETGAETMRITAAHEKPIDIIKYVNEQTVATGDEAGNVKLWDVRKKKQAFAYKEHVDYISDMEFCLSKRHLLATSGDGCLSVYDVRKAKPFHVSANQDDELLSLAIMRGGKKVVVGETDGVLGIFSYGQFGDVSDRFPGHPQSIDTICKLTEELCVTGSSDGLLRIVQLFPHKLVGIAGDHQALPVEKVVLSYDQQWLASCSHDHMVHFWDIGYIFNGSEEDEEAADDMHGSDDGLDVQAVAIRISKDVDGGEDGDDGESEVDIDGCSDGSELKPADRKQLGARTESPDASNTGDSDDGDGWGSWGGISSDDGGGTSAKKSDQKGKAKAKIKAKRKMSSEPFRLSKQRKRKDGKSATFFSGL